MLAAVESPVSALAAFLTEAMNLGGSQAAVELVTVTALLLLVSFGIGIVAVMAGVGGGVLFVPVVLALFPVHPDLVRGTGILVALIGSVSAAPRLLREGLSEQRVSIPLALTGSVGSILGALLGLRVPERGLLLLLTIFMVGVAVQTAWSGFRPANMRRHRSPEDPQPGETRGTAATGSGPGGWIIRGSYVDPATRLRENWEARRLPLAAVLMFAIGGLGGMLGVGAGWANVPVLASLVGLPLRMAAATSGLVIVGNASAAGWIYLGAGALLPIVVIPSLAGVVGGTRIGARLLGRADPRVIRALIIVMLLLAAWRTAAGLLG